MKNKEPAEIQITMEQLLREAKERDFLPEILPPLPKQKISGPHELVDYQHRKRKKFEDITCKNPMSIINWIKYAKWERSQNQILRARSIYERALEVNYWNIRLWLKYAEMEMHNQQVDRARNLWDRAVTLLPRANQFWYKYTHMEERLENIVGARQVFERWMAWEPHEQAWQTYINFELRYKEIDRARRIYEHFVMIHPDVNHWIKYARFEESYGFINSARAVYERAVNFYRIVKTISSSINGDEDLDEKLFLAYARFEEDQQEYDHARVIYKYALDHVRESSILEIYKAYAIFEKKYGDSSDIERVINSKRKYIYLEEIKENPFNYDAWFDYLNLLESEGNIDVIRDTYEQVIIPQQPPNQEKDFWRRYIYLWIKYALFEELQSEDIEHCRHVYRACLGLIPHKKFSFSKIWLLYANFEVRQKNFTQAKQILGTALKICPSNKLFRSYIDLEEQLMEFNHCRQLYEKFLEFNPENCNTWIQYAELETRLGEINRARAIFECAVARPQLDMSEILWKSYIDFEIVQGKTENARQLFERLFERLLESTLYVTIWISYAKFELLNPRLKDNSDNIVLVRHIFERGNEALKFSDNPEGRVLLLEAWKDFESENGTPESLAKIMEKMPRKVKKKMRRWRIIDEDGSEENMGEEVLHIMFPEDES